MTISIFTEIPQNGNAFNILKFQDVDMYNNLNPCVKWIVNFLKT